ncbi:MAG: nitronate monooxygenase [Gammaproteobacteria bacterium]|nr:nitronate monooxygenase [Gammaproteobacteria bacterium]
MPEQLVQELVDLKLPLICAGGIGSAGNFVRALQPGYAGVQLGTRLIASHECHASVAYKTAILRALAEILSIPNGSPVFPWR